MYGRAPQEYCFLKQFNLVGLLSPCPAAATILVENAGSKSKGFWNRLVKKKNIFWGLQRKAFGWPVLPELWGIAK